MNFFLRNLKEQACMLRSGEYCQNIKLETLVRFDEGGNQLVMLHNAILLPHWQEFIDALQLYTHSEASNTFSISNVQLTPVIFNMLAPALKGKRFKLFSLSENDFQDNCGDGIDFVIEFMKNKLDLISFSWSGNTIEDTNDSSHLIKAINNLPSLDTITISNSFTGDVDAYNLLCSLLEGNEHCERIEFQFNNMWTMGGARLSEFLATNPILCHLDLSGNSLNDGDATLIVDSLKLNSNLRDLVIGGNEITDVGYNALRDAIFDSSSLNSAVDSNHTCQIIGPDFGDIPANISDIPGSNRKAKIYSIMCSRNRDGSNAHYLDLELGDDSLKFVPNVLECIDRCADPEHYLDGTVPPLSILYEVLRSWKIPSIYEAHTILTTASFTEQHIGVVVRVCINKIVVKSIDSDVCKHPIQVGDVLLKIGGNTPMDLLGGRPINMKGDLDRILAIVETAPRPLLLTFGRRANHQVSSLNPMLKPNS